MIVTKRLSMPTRHVNLTDHFDHSSRLASPPADIATASEVVREGLRLLEQREREDHAKLEWLRHAAMEGFDQIDRGEGIEFHSMDDLDAHIDQLGEEASAELAVERGGG